MEIGLRNMDIYVGNDIIEVNRIQESIENLGDKFISINEMKNAFTNNALDYYEQNGGSIDLESIFSGSVYTIFGQVYSGLETVDAIAGSETDSSDKPLEDVIIEKITIEPYQAQ